MRKSKNPQSPGYTLFAAHPVDNVYVAMLNGIGWCSSMTNRWKSIPMFQQLDQDLLPFSHVPSIWLSTLSSNEDDWLDDCDCSKFSVVYLSFIQKKKKKIFLPSIFHVKTVLKRHRIPPPPRPKKKC